MIKMKTNAMKKALLVLGLGLSASMSGIATAAPGDSDCDDLRALCAQGNANACFVLSGLAHYCNR
jgi:hypothetical protein